MTDALLSSINGEAVTLRGREGSVRMEAMTVVWYL